MKLYYMPGACSLAPHIVANEAGLAFEAIRVDGASKRTERDEDFRGINPNGYVPALALDDGQVLTETSVIVQYLADRKPGSGLIPAAGTMERYRVQQTLAFIASELHKSFTPFFKPGTPEEAKTAGRAHLAQRIAYIDGQLEGRGFLTGETFTAADAYLWTVLGWAGHAGVDLSGFANVQRFLAAVASRPAVQQSLREEGLA
jgi:glutathione S-transferase